MNSNFKLVYTLIGKRRLNEAYRQLIEINADIKNNEIKKELNSLSSIYNKMLDELLKNSEHKLNDNQYNELVAKSYEAADRLYTDYSILSSSTYYMSQVKKKRDNPGYAISDLQVQLETYSHIIDTFDSSDEAENSEKKYILEAHDISIDELFEKIIATTVWSSNDEIEAYDMFLSTEIKNYDKSILVSAVTVSLINYFDSKKFRFLLKAYRNSNVEIKQRAVVGIALVTLFNEDRIVLYSELMALYNQLNNDINFNIDICNVQLLLLMTKETNRISKTVREDIMPSFFESNESEKELGENDIELQKETSDNLYKNEDYAINQMEILHKSGADICMNTFSTLKQDNFFDAQSHWFFPFFEEQKDIITISDEYKKNSMLLMLLKIGFLCNSDKYSFCLTLLKIPKRQRDTFVNELNKNDVLGELGIKAFNENDDELLSSYKVCELYIHDLYRYFKLWKYKNEITDVFDNKFELWKCEPLNKSLNNFDVLKKVASYYLKFNHYEQAIKIYSDLINQMPTNNLIFKKLGFAYQKNGQYENAIDCYLRASLIKTDSLWLDYHIAHCYYRIKNYKIALDYYLMIEKARPDDFDTELQIGFCLANLKDYSGALKYLFKVEYLNPKSNQAKKAIAWCYFLLHRYSESLNYYKQIVRATNANFYDILNYSHVLFANHEFQKALKYYKKALSRTSEGEFTTMYMADRKYLLESNIKDTDIKMMLDMVL